MKLRSDYSKQLNRFLMKNIERPFEWGTWDCCIFAAEAVKIMTGEDHLPYSIGDYDSRRGAARMLRNKGQGTLYKTVEHICGQPISNMTKAQVGDLVMMGGNLGICTGTRAVFLEEEGMIWFPMSEVAHCFSIR